MLQFDEPLQFRREALQAEYGVLLEKLSELRFKHGYVAGTSENFQIGKEIEQTEAALDRLEKDISALDQRSTDWRVYQALLKLGYRKQVQTFRQFVEREPIAAFLIHGKYEYGQQWLLNRLVVQHTRNSLTGKIIRVNLWRIAQQNDVPSLWRELRKEVGLGRQHGEVPAIVERVYQWWRTQNVLLLLHNVDFLHKEFLSDLLQNFWTPLVTQATQETSARDRSGSVNAYKLLMFLVDYTGRVENWSVSFAETREPAWHPRIPIKLPVLSEFTASELTNWLEFSADDFPVEWINRVDETVQDILQSSDNGVPEPTFEEICQRLGLRWSEAEKRWMKF